MTLAMNLPPCGSYLSIYRYDGDGVLFPTTVLLEDRDGKYWKFKFQCPAELSDIPPDDFDEQPGEERLSRNERQKKVRKEQEQDNSSFSSTNEWMKNGKPWGEGWQQNSEGSSSSSTWMQNEKWGEGWQQNSENSSSSSTWMQNEKRAMAIKQRSPETKPPANDQRHLEQTRIVPQAYGSAQEAQEACRRETWRDKWSKEETVAWMLKRRTAKVCLPRRGRWMSVHKYVGDGVLFPTIAWLKDDTGQYWMVELQGPAELTDIPADECKQQPGEELRPAP